MLAYLFGLIAVGLYNYKAFKTLAWAKSYRELALVMTAVSIAFFNVGMWLACVPELSTNTNLATTFLLASAGFQCSMTLMEGRDHFDDRRPDEVWVFAGILLLMCAACVPSVIKNPLISVITILVSTQVMAKEELVSSGRYLRALSLKS